LKHARAGLGLGLGFGAAIALGVATLGLGAADAGPPHLLPVPIISQATPWTCGPASLMAALVYFGLYDDTESRLATELGATPEQGIDPGSIAALARRLGLHAEVRTGLTLDDLAAELARGSVVILAVQAWAARPVDPATDWEDGHYVVLVGIDEARVYAMDPSVRTGYAFLERDALLARWHDYDVRGGRREAYQHLGVVLRGRAALRSYPGAPTRIE
jgi:predicted double-glycine peptidase